MGGGAGSGGGVGAAGAGAGAGMGATEAGAGAGAALPVGASAGGLPIGAAAGALPVGIGARNSNLLGEAAVPAPAPSRGMAPAASRPTVAGVENARPGGASTAATSIPGATVGPLPDGAALPNDVPGTGDTAAGTGDAVNLGQAASPGTGTRPRGGTGASGAGAVGTAVGAGLVGTPGISNQVTPDQLAAAASGGTLATDAGTTSSPQGPGSDLLSQDQVQYPFLVPLHLSPSSCFFKNPRDV